MLRLLVCIIIFTNNVFSLEYINKKHSFKDVLIDQGIVLSGHTLGYLVTQEDTISEEGSWEDYNKNFLKFKFDNDNTNWNFFGHTYTGSQVYLYYRSQGYVERQALYYSFLSSLYFEVIIENYTENPSFQDTFNTPFFGSALGYVFERWSIELINSDNIFYRGLGRVINPFSFFVDEEKVSFIPYIDRNKYAFMWSYPL